MESDRFFAALVAACLLKSPRGEILLTEKNGKLTIPTGHMDPEKDTDSKEALTREMEEELIGLKDLIIVESLGTYVVNGFGQKAKSIEIFSCKTSSEEIGCLIEKGEKKAVFWIRPIEAIKLPNLDGLTKEALERYLFKYSRKKKEGQSDECIE